MNDSRRLLGGLSPAEFLRAYWQRRPLFVHQALPGFQSPVRPNDLAGLACEEDVESRLVLEKGGQQPWELRHGPFSTEDFASLPKTHWILLVQEINKHLAEAEQLMARFDFIPTWRIDDVMVSFSPEHGSVGPHVDSYDVFLVQAQGRKRWQVAGRTDTRTAFLAGLELRILREFTPEQEWVLEPGDMLYLPPGVAHHGVALGDTQTWSVGFRAPSHADMLTAMAEHMTKHLDTEARYEDPELLPAAAPAEINSEVLARVQNLVRGLVQTADPADWFGRLVTENHSGLEPEPPAQPMSPSELLASVRDAGTLIRANASRFAYVRRPSGAALLFVDGESFELDARSAPAASQVADRGVLTYETLARAETSPHLLAVITELYNRGRLYFAE